MRSWRARPGSRFERIEGRFLVGSFQRDSLGADLGRPKWQKDPDLLLDVLDALRSENVLLLLAGPRRHYVLEACRERSIPYLFVGREPEPGARDDDIEMNSLPVERIGALWNLIDLYVVPSRAEGGPKALLEAGLTETPIVSTPAGMAPDLLPDSLLFRDAAEGAALVRAVIFGENEAEQRDFFRRVQQLDRFDAFRGRVDAAVAAAASCDARG